MKRRQIIEIYRKKNRFERLCNYLERYQKLYIYLYIYIYKICKICKQQQQIERNTQHTHTQQRKQAKRRKTKQCYKYGVFWRGTSSTKEERKSTKKVINGWSRMIGGSLKKNNKQTNVAKNIKRKKLYI